MNDELNKEPLEEQLEKIIRKKSDENLALKNLLQKLEDAETEMERKADKRNSKSQKQH